jgi:hypothetical protein
MNPSFVPPWVQDEIRMRVFRTWVR